MTVRMEDVSKRFGRQWVIKQFSEAFHTDTIYGIRGRNGSGKSTLLRMLSGQLSPSRGRVVFQKAGVAIPPDRIYRYVSWTGPYFEVVEELTVLEMLTFHFRLKPAAEGMTPAIILDRTGLTPFADRPLLDCSSGMRQRILLATALYAAAPILLLDEPTVTLDREAAEWFEAELQRFAVGRLTVIASNDPRDLKACASVTDL
ncbi:ABC transporter family protein [Neolewinella xylanilytica]|uniref:ABC transporter family protein n=2 Tax=Neolewinella xylanilytica TaxID=1514080 RepID=A0A2S6I0A8_9BACT|nr:ABC transporter family protein [Neolewinella xylanilytica]